AQLWDGSTTWLRRPTTTPTLQNLAFTADVGQTRSGEFTFDVDGFAGQLEIEIDVNGDGDFDDPEDRALPVAVSASGTVSVEFDGLDGQGAPIPATQDLNARVAITRIGEIHFLNDDVETRAGLSVRAVNGPQAGSTTLYWNDTDLVADGRICVTPQ